MGEIYREWEKEKEKDTLQENGLTTSNHNIIQIVISTFSTIYALCLELCSLNEIPSES